GGLISCRRTIFLWQSIAAVVIEMAVVTTVMWLATPPPSRARTARDLGIELAPDARGHVSSEKSEVRSTNGHPLRRTEDDRTENPRTENQNQNRGPRTPTP